MGDLRSKSWSRIAIGGLFTLAAVSLAGTFLARREMETHSRNHSERLDAMRRELMLCRSLLDQTSVAATRSRERLSRIRSLDVAPGPSARRATMYHLHDASVEGWDAAADDLVSLTQFSPGSPEVVQMLLRSAEEMLGAEIEVWRQINGFAERRGARQSDEGAFQQIRHTLKEHREREESFQNALSKVGVELSRKGMEESTELERFAEGALERSRTKLVWSGLGLAALGIGLPFYAFCVFWSELNSKRPDETILLANRTGT